MLDSSAMCHGAGRNAVLQLQVRQVKGSLPKTVSGDRAVDRVIVEWILRGGGLRSAFLLAPCEVALKLLGP